MGLFDSLFETESEVETRSRAYPMPATAPGLTAGISGITDWMRTPRQYFPGQTYAGITPDQLAAIEQMKAAAGAAGGLVPGITDAYMGALGRPEEVLGMGLQDVASNPYLAGVADVLEARSQRRMEEDILPQMEASAVGRGGLGGSRLAVNAERAERDRQLGLNEALAGLYGSAWEQGLGAETSRYNQALAGTSTALGQAPTIMGALQLPGSQLFGAGGRERAEEQLGINEAMARFNFEQMEPFERAQMGLGALMGPAQAFGENQTRERGTVTPSTFSQIGSLLGAGSGLAGMIGGMGPFGGGGTAIPAGTPYGGYGQFSTLPGGWGASPFYGMPDPWGGASYGMWG